MQHFQAIRWSAEVKQKLSPTPGQLKEEEEEVEVCIVHSSLPNVALIPATPAQPSVRPVSRHQPRTAARRPALGSRVPACAAAGASWPAARSDNTAAP